MIGSSVSLADLVRGNWLWFVWAGIAVCVVVGYVVVRRRLHRVEAAGDAPSGDGVPGIGTAYRQPGQRLPATTPSRARTAGAA
jgi:hypothetical protein